MGVRKGSICSFISYLVEHLVKTLKFCVTVHNSHLVKILTFAPLKKLAPLKNSCGRAHVQNPSVKEQDSFNAISMQATFIYISDLLKNQPTQFTQSSAQFSPIIPFWLKITDRCFYHQAPALQNSLPNHLQVYFILQCHLASAYRLLYSKVLHFLSSNHFSQFHNHLKT